MDLSELAAYAEKKYQIREQHKWAEFPNFSVLADPFTGKWIALLMRQRDPKTGASVQRCDLKCGALSREMYDASYLTDPFRMKGVNWVGITFDEQTDPDIVCRLFDRAVYAGEPGGYTIVLDEPARPAEEHYQETLLSFSPSGSFSAADDDIPEKIREMMRLYHYGDGSFRQKCKNFYRQGKFMENYEDDQPWHGEFLHYFPTYHDLNTDQLRGYFTWRTAVRKGTYEPVSTSLAYIYIYELLNGIGTSSVEDTLRKLNDFEKGYLDSGIGDEEMKKNLCRWMLDYSVINGVPPETVRKFADPELLARDEALMVLKEPAGCGDEEIFSALCLFAGEKLMSSPVFTKNESKAKHLFAEVWRYGSQFYYVNNKKLFTACFGTQTAYHWYPLANAVWYSRAYGSPDTVYELDPCRRYRCRYGVWFEEKYENLHFEKKRFQILMRETDRLLRIYLNTGHPLKERPENDWALPFIAPIIEIDRKAEREAAKPKITIDLSGLEQIRRDALVTRDSLLTEEEKAEDPLIESPQPAVQDTHEEISAEESHADPQPVSIAFTPEPLHKQILERLLQGNPVDALIRENHLIPSVVTDEINEALFDEIGDNILECDGNTIDLVEDYREDVLHILGGNSA